MNRLEEITRTIQNHNPDTQLFWYDDRTALGYWSHNLGRVQVLAGKLLDGRWGILADILVNDKPLFQADRWEPVRHEWIY